MRYIPKKKKSQYPLLQNPSVIRTLLDRCFSAVSEEKDREEEVHITSAFKTCVYPRWSIENQKDIMVSKERKNWKGKEKLQN